MRRKEINKKFDEWWKAQSELPARDRPKARLVFAAACPLVAKPRVYRFQSGRWIVTVQARTEDDAKIMATAKLNERARKFMSKPPIGGWGIRSIDGDEIARPV